MIDRAISVVVALSFMIGEAVAYDLSFDAAGTEDKIVRDVQDNTLDVSHFTQRAREGLAASIHSPLAMEIIGSALQKVCPTISVDNNYGRQYQFRSIHQAGEVDWIITTPHDDPTTVESLSFFVLPQGASGAPAILPILPDPNLKTPPAQVGCLTQFDRERAAKQVKAACDQFPELCPTITRTK
jgi:hypothetical protein